MGCGKKVCFKFVAIQTLLKTGAFLAGIEQASFRCSAAERYPGTLGVWYWIQRRALYPDMQVVLVVTYVLFIDDHFVANAPNGFNVYLVAAAQTISEMGNVDIYSAGFAVKIETPGQIKQLFA